MIELRTISMRFKEFRNRSQPIVMGAQRSWTGPGFRVFAEIVKLANKHKIPAYPVHIAACTEKRFL